MDAKLVRAVIQVESAYQQRGAFAEGRDGADAADARHGAAVRASPIRTIRRRISKPASSISRRCCSGCRATGARRLQRGRSRGSAAQRHSAVSRDAELRLADHSAAREPVEKTSNLTQPFAALHGLTSQGDRAEIDTIAACGISLPARVANGEIVEGVYVADNEARLRHELEEKGLYVLSLQPKGAIAGVSLQPAAAHGDQHARVPRLQPGTGDAAQGRHAAGPVARSAEAARRRRRCSARVLDDVHEKVRSGTALSDAFAAHGDLFPARLHGLAARRRAQRQPRRGAAALRRVHEDHRDGEAQDGLGAGLPGDSDLARARARRRSSC